MSVCRTLVCRWLVCLAAGLPSAAFAESPASDKPGMVFYEPAPNYPAADNWCFKKDNLWYVYTLNGHGQDSIGVAVSPDLVHFDYRGVAIPSVPGTWEHSLYGGDVFAWKGKHYMLYSAPGPEMVNVIGLAESDDLLQWKKHPGNPVMRDPDARWYEGSTQDGMRGGISCRDVSVIDEATTDEWVYVCFTGSTGRGDYYRRGCVGLARSQNLVDWEYLPPLFSPGLYTALEVPRVCRIGNKWFLTWLHAPWYGLRTDEDHGQRAYTNGETMIHYAVADHPLGPYHLPNDPTLFRGVASPYVIDLVHDDDQAFVTSTMFMQQGPQFGDRARKGLLPAMPIRQAEGHLNRLEVRFPEKLRGVFTEKLPLIDTLRVNNPLPELQDVTKEGDRFDFSQTSNRLVELTEPTAADLLVETQWNAKSGRVGLVTRYSAAARSGCVILVDAQRKELQFAEIRPLYRHGISAHVLERHAITSPIDANFRLSVIQSADYQMVFINDVLAATFSFARRDPGVVGLFLENATGEGVVHGIHTRKL